MLVDMRVIAHRPHAADSPKATELLQEINQESLRAESVHSTRNGHDRVFTGSFVTLQSAYKYFSFSPLASPDAKRQRRYSSSGFLIFQAKREVPLFLHPAEAK